MNACRFTPAAIMDLEAICDFVAQDKPQAAFKLIDRLESASEQIAQSPGIGRMREELAVGLQSFPVGKYVIFYRVRGSAIEVIRVLHSSRDMEVLFR